MAEIQEINNYESMLLLIIYVGQKVQDDKI